MQKILKICLLALMPAWTFIASSQDYRDVLRYSEKFYQGTARSAGSGNAFGSLGADFTGININPAGLAMYRRPELNFTFNFNQQSSTATYYGSDNVDDKYNFNIGNIGLVVADVRTELGQPVEEGWVSVNFALGFNRTNSFHSNAALSGTTKNTILRAFKDDADGTPYNDLNPFSYGYLAYQTWLLDYDSINQTYLMANRAEPADQFQVAQADYISNRGAMNDLMLSVAGNYSNRFYVGANLLFPTVGYTSIRTFKERNITENPVYYRTATVIDSLHTSGIGFSAALGIIYRLTNQLRLGAAVQFPTFYSLNDDYSYNMSSTLWNGKAYTQSSPLGTYSYKIVTPPRYTLSGSYLIGKFGFVSLDYELVDYTAGRINTRFEGVQERNMAIRNTLNTGHNIRAGTEWRIDKFALRAGYQYYSSPYAKDMVPDEYDGSSNVISLGAGFRDQDYYLDVAYMRHTQKYFYLPFTTSSGQEEPEGANIKSVRGNVLITIGTRF